MDTNLFKYEMFLAEQLSEQAKYEACLNEAILISSGENNIVNMQLVQESFTDKIKDSIKKIFDFFKRMWSKFIEAMDTLIKKDKDYLEKYKDIILNKKPIDAVYTMYNYKDGIKKILSTSIPAFNYNIMKDSLESNDTFIQKHFPDFKPQNEQNFIDVAKVKFRGGEKQVKINSNQLNMTDIYNYCVEYDKMRTSMKKDEATITKASVDANNIIDKMVREEKIKNTNESFIFRDNKYYSYLYEAYILENDNPNGNTNNNSSNNQNNSSNNNDKKDGEQQINKNITREENDKDKSSNNSNDNKDKQGVKEDDFKGEDVNDAKKRIEVYAKVCGDMMAAKLTITEEIYKAYMSIIKTHVRDHLKKKDSSDDNKAKDVATTDYSGNNNEKDPEVKKTEEMEAALEKDKEKLEKLENDYTLIPKIKFSLRQDKKKEIEKLKEKIIKDAKTIEARKQNYGEGEKDNNDNKEE